ncbi:GPH family glycoside/pentoside/hexuronide:cation symporter [Microbacterium foliorum]|uniref:GPH family glycoside/pentoside/hexuronide:cation symporter n=1 Tax=Microbacterium foliorum TaxID=104336 RepID=A0ABU1HWB5_9MICO|nr:MFS transporter [Microbacterium foliorum]MDR6143963.1 GPH family glycoside/pentoside/hexuronide:cation symporter [Microbacterium foliorum]
MSTAARPEAASVRLSARTVALYAIGSLGTGGYATLPGLVLTYFLTDNLGVAALTAGLIVTGAKIWDVIIDPVIGAASDRQYARTGSRRGFMVAGGLTLPVFFALTFAVPPSWGPTAGAVCVLLAFLATATSFSLFQVPYVALPAELTSGYDERTRLLGWRVVVLTAAILLSGAGGPELRGATADPVAGYLLMGVVAGVVIGVGMLIASRTADAAAHHMAADERPTAVAPAGLREQYAAGVRTLRRSQPFRALLGTFVLQALATGTMLAGAQYVATWVLRSEDAVTLVFLALVGPALLATPGWTVVARRLGKERAFALASILFLIAAASLVLAVWTPGPWMYGSIAVAGIAYAGLQSLPMAMLPDVISHDERRTGRGQAGTFTGVWTAGETVGFALGASTVSLTLAATGYVSSVAGTTMQQPDAAITGIVLAFSILPALLMAASLLTLRRYRLRRADIDA